MMSTARFRPAETALVTLKLGVDWSTLMYAKSRWVGEELFEKIFHRSRMTTKQFLDWNYSPGVEPVGCYADEKLIGIGWICQAYLIEGRRIAEVGAAFFKGTPLAEWHRALDLFLSHAFVERDFTDIYGLSSRDNPSAHAILHYCGMPPVDTLPWGQEIPADTIASRLTRDEWEANGRQKAN